MSKEIDSRVVELRFDNKDFEKNTKDSLNSLNKLDKSINQLGSNKGMSNLQQSVNNFSMDDIAEAAELIKHRFSALGIIGMSVMNRLTNSVMNFAHSAVEMFSPFTAMKDGMEEYELQINSVQTMLANYNSTAMDTAQIAAGYMSDQVEQLRDMAGSVIRGDWGNGMERYNLLTAAGYDYDEIQSAVNTVMWAEGTIEDNLAKLDGTVTRTGQNISDTTSDASSDVVDNTSEALKHVTAVLDDLNEYADRTVYKFGDMTNAIGTFMTAGVDLDTAAMDVQGLSNLAAAVGANNEQLQRSMYMLSQGIAAGKISLLQWRSLERTAGMGGKMFQDALIKTAKEHGIAVDAMIKKNGSFRDSLKEDWLTADIMNETLKKFTLTGLTDYFAKDSSAKDAHTRIGKIMQDVKDLREEAETDAEIADIANKKAKELAKYTKMSEAEVRSYLHQALKMEDAATKVKTFTQLKDVIREQLGTGWATTWKYIIGDFEEAKKLWTKVSKSILPIFEGMANARNDMLKDWHDRGGRGDLIESMRNLWHALKSFAKPINEAFRELFPRTTSDQLLTLTKRLKAFTATLEINETHQKAIKGIFKGVFTIVKGIITVIKTVIKVVAKVIYALAPIGKLIVDIVGGIGHLISKIGEGISKSGVFQKVTSLIYKGLNAVHKGLSRFVKWIENLGIWRKIYDGAGKVGDFLLSLGSKIKKRFTNILQTIFGSKAFQKFYKSFERTRAQVISSFEEGLEEDEESRWDRMPRFIQTLVVLFNQLKQTRFGQWVSKLANSIKKSFIKLKNTGFAKWIKDLWSSFKNTGIPRILSALSAAFNKFKEVMAKVWGKIKEVFGFGGSNKDAFEKIAKSSKKAADGLTTISNAVGTAGEKFKAFGGFDSIANALNPDKLLENLSKSSRFSKFKNKFKNVFGQIKDFIKGDDEELTLDTILNIGKSFGFLGLQKATSKSMTMISESVSTIFRNVGVVIGRTTKVLKTFQNSLRAKMIRDIAIAIALVAGSIFLLSQVPADKLENGLVAIAAVGGILAGLFIVVARVSQGLNTKAIIALNVSLGLLAFVLIGMGVAAFGVAAAVGALVLALKGLRYVVDDYRKAMEDDPEGFFLGIQAVGQMIKLLSGYLRATFLKGWHGAGVAIELLAIVAALWLLYRVIKMYATIPADDFMSAATKFATILAILSSAMLSMLGGVVFISAGKMFGAAAVLISLVVILRVMISIIEKLINMAPGDLSRGIERLSSLVGLIAGFMVAISLSLLSIKAPGVKISGGTMGKLLGVASVLVSLSAILSVAAGAIIKLGVLDNGTFWRGMAFVTIIVAELAAFIILVTKFANKDTIGGVSKILRSLMVAIVSCIAVVALLGSMKTSIALKGVALLGAILTALGVFIHFAKFESDPKALATLAVVLVGVTIIITALISLSKQPFKKILAATLGLAAVMASIGVMIKLAGKGFNIGDILFMLGVSVTIVIIAEALSVLASYPVKNVLAATLGLSAVILAAAGAMALMSKLHISVASAAKIAIVISAFIAIIVGAFFGIFELLGGLFNKFETLQPRLEKGIEAAELIFGGIGRMFGALVGEFQGTRMEHLSSHLDKVGADLDKFTDHVGPFFDTIKDVDTTQLSDVSDSLDMITTAMQLISTWGPDQDITPQLEIFDSSVVPLGESLVSFSNTVKDIDVNAVSAAADALDAISKIDTSKAAQYSDTGKSQFSMLKEGLADVAEGIVDFSDSVSGKNIDLDAIKNAVDAINLIVGIDTSKGKESVLPWKSSELEGFGDGLSIVGTGITEFSKKVSEDGKINVAAIDTAVTAMKAIASIDTAKFTGKSAGNFKSFLGVSGGLGKRISEFSKNVSGDNKINLAAIDTASQALGKLAAINFSTYDSTNAESFSSNLTFLGTNLSTFNEKIDEIDLEAMGNDVKTFIDSIVSADLTTATTTLEGFALALESAGAKAAGNFGTALNPTTASTTVVNFCMAAFNTMLSFTGVAPTYGLNFALAIASGLTAGSSFMMLAAQGAAQSGADGAKSKYDAFVAAGSYLTQGLAQGINDPEAVAKVISAAQVLASIANVAFRNASDIDSPSKVFATNGMYLVLGLAKGMLDNANQAAEASKTLSDAVFAGFDQAMFDDIDPNPTIRPVLDLSSVQSGARTLNSLLGGYAPYTSFGLAGTISNGMDAGIQNGRNIYDNSSNVINLTVNGAEGQDVNALADAVVNKIITVNRRKAAMNG